MKALGYCTNVYSGTSWVEILNCLEVAGSRLRSPHRQSSVLGLWLPAVAAEKAVSEGLVGELLAICKSSNIEIGSLNGFPFGTFHGEKIKEKVFYPDWTDPERVRYSLALMELASALPGATKDFGISTLPLSYKRGDNEVFEKATLNLVEMAAHAFYLENEKGSRLHLDLEPEPYGVLETSKEAVAFYKEFLLKEGALTLSRRLGVDRSRAEAILLDKIRICYDTCHAAVEFESPSELLTRYSQNGILIGKVQISSAVVIQLEKGRCFDGSRPSQALSVFQDQRYLHQVIGIDSDGKLKKYPDLPEAIQEWEENQSSGEFRVHFHVPVYLKNYGPLSTTQDHLHSLFEYHRNHPVCEYWEVETYTWEILPKDLRRASLEECMLDELSWVRNKALGGENYVSVETLFRAGPRVQSTDLRE